jgi:ubiquitin-activating enzyme E1
MKSVAAAAAARAMNPEFRVEAHTNRLCEDSLNVYNDTFYQSLSGVCNALDNVPARIFSDSRCLLYRLPLIDGGTLGATGDFQPIVPDLTDHYRGVMDDARGIPMCTLHHFPTNIEHTTMWAKDIFVGYFEDAPRAAQKVSDPGFAERAQDEPASVLEAAKAFLVTERCSTFADCARWARLKFEENFNWKIRDLQKSYPEDAVTENGLPVWGGNKRYPRPAVFDTANPLHAAFVSAAAVIRARVSGILIEGDPVALASAVEVPEWKPTPPPVDPDVAVLLAEVGAVVGSPVVARPDEFEKDDDKNGHIDFIAAAANIRAGNYGIAPKDKLAIKKIAGRIIPAIATTTAMVCGFASLEMYKIHGIEKKELKDLRYGQIDLAAPLYNMMEPRQVPPKWVQPGTGKKFTDWDSFYLEGDLTLREFLAALKEKYDVVPETISADAGTFYGLLADDDPKLLARLDRKISETLVQEFGAAPLGEGQTLLHLELLLPDCYSEDEVPPSVLLKVR